IRHKQFPFAEDPASSQYIPCSGLDEKRNSSEASDKKAPFSFPCFVCLLPVLSFGDLTVLRQSSVFPTLYRIFCFLRCVPARSISEHAAPRFPISRRLPALSYSP